MKAWVITEDEGYDVGTVIRAVAGSEEAARRWVAEHCDADARALRAYGRTKLDRLKNWQCDHRFCYDIEPYEVVE